MLNLFRKTRKKLADDNKPMKYFRYAIGEIVLVVIGILIALNINNWNINQTNKKEEKFYLQKLKLNLAQDTTYVQDRLNQITRHQILMDSFLLEIENPELLSLSNKYFTMVLVSQYGFSPQTSTFDNLIATGKLNLITNQTLVDSLFVYYNNLNNYTKQRIEGMETYGRNTIVPYLMKFDEIALLDGVPQKKPIEYGNDVFIINAIKLKYHILRGLKGDYEVVYKRSVNLIEMINKVK